MSWILNTCSVILLTTLLGCSGIPLIGASTDNDPVSRAALQLRTPAADREAGSNPKATSLAQAIQQGIFWGDLVQGMSIRDVVQAWGRPHRILYAGDPEIHNEKWIYTDGPTENGKMRPVKTVYLTEGRVTGWETSILDLESPQSGSE